VWKERVLQELRQALSNVRQRYNQPWIVERLGYRSPAQARADFSLALAQAA
jgi:transposase InsO family protein